MTTVDQDVLVTPAEPVVPAHNVRPAALAAASLTALGVVFGDIGTSPLYTLKTIVELAGGKPSPDAILGFVSLIVWTLFIITTIKYVALAMQIDNDGEGLSANRDW